MGIAALPAYVCKSELRSRQLTRILPGWLAGESTFTALLPHRLGLLPAVRIFVDYLARHLPSVYGFRTDTPPTISHGRPMIFRDCGSGELLDQIVAEDFDALW